VAATIDTQAYVDGKKAMAQRSVIAAFVTCVELLSLFACDAMRRKSFQSFRLKAISVGWSWKSVNNIWT
jgi:hypothetical protein